ncbi:hypothetical protein D9758_003033 [Tetrapyrgos nigripes]|uniref:Glutathione transferase n=1 Tax=Tetrapyrgos nigripes TaxID=182062 RepID=A0A8H5LTC3_9AGAR|nr:hypothetical protein D9758_003033 [Tetrapyrgos nigripes]
MASGCVLPNPFRILAITEERPSVHPFVLVIVYAEADEAEKSFEKMKFNCIQRAHQNTLETLPMIYLTTIISAFKYPIFAASACGLWTVARLFYTWTYGSGHPAKRSLSSRIGFFILISLIGVSSYTTVTGSLALLS